jgi:hypothetical protein
VRGASRPAAHNIPSSPAAAIEALVVVRRSLAKGRFRRLIRRSPLPQAPETLHEYTYDVWWPEYAEVSLGDETRDNYATQLDLWIIPKWGKHPLRTLEAGPIEAWVTK